MSVPLALLQKYILESGSLFRKFVTQDGTQTPAAATLNIFRQGATAVGAATVPAHAFEFLVTVNSSGRFAIGDLIAIGSTVTSTLVVDDIPNSTQLSLTNLGGQAVAIPAGVRLLPANDRPQFYSVDASGVPTSSTAIGSVVSTNSQTGIAAAALTETGLFDLLISGSNVAARFETDQGGPTWCVQPAVLNAAFYGSIQAAIDALPPEGGEVYVPQGTWIITAPIVIPERTTFGGVKLRGDGWWRTKIQSTNAATDMIQIQTSYTTLEGLHFVGPGAPGNGKGIVIFKGTPGADFAWIRIADCRVEDSPSWALDAGGTGSRNVTECSYERCSFVNGNRDGVVRV